MSRPPPLAGTDHRSGGGPGGRPDDASVGEQHQVEPTGGRSVLGLSDVVHQRVRLGILSVLVEVDRADFTYLRQVLELSDGNLARHLSVLAEAGYVELRKDSAGRRPRTWAVLTAAGTRAFRQEIEALRRIVGAHDQTTPSAGNRRRLSTRRKGPQ